MFLRFKIGTRTKFLRFKLTRSDHVSKEADQSYVSKVQSLTRSEHHVSKEADQSYDIVSKVQSLTRSEHHVSKELCF